MIVCLCRGVSDRAVRAAVASGASTLDEVGDRCGAGAGCGACHETVEGLIREGGAPGCPRGGSSGRSSLVALVARAGAIR
jgi:bacterioferritin-associated ferredoxin